MWRRSRPAARTWPAYPQREEVRRAGHGGRSTSSSPTPMPSSKASRQRRRRRGRQGDHLQPLGRTAGPGRTLPIMWSNWPTSAPGRLPAALSRRDDRSVRRVETVAKKIYGADDHRWLRRKGCSVSWQRSAEDYGHFPVCMAKTQYSFSTDPDMKGAPSGFTVPIREVRLSATAPNSSSPSPGRS